MESMLEGKSSGAVELRALISLITKQDKSKDLV